VYVGQTEVSTGVTVCQPYVSEPETMKNYRMEIMGVESVLSEFHAAFVR